MHPQRTLRSLVAAWAITFVVYRDHISDLRDAHVFSSRILMFIGKISYGRYLYHIFFPWMYHIINAPINEMLPAALSPYMAAITFTENFLMLIFISWMSYRFLERPIINIKKLQRISARQARADMRAAAA